MSLSKRRVIPSWASTRRAEAPSSVAFMRGQPLIKFYEAKGLLRKIDGNQGPEKNAAAFKAAMCSFEFRSA